MSDLKPQPPQSTPSKSPTFWQKYEKYFLIAFWLLIFAGLYVFFNTALKPKPSIVTAAGELVIPKHRDGHFYVNGSINGKPIEFLIDTGASKVSLSQAFAKQAGLAKGTPTTFNTANGEAPGEIVSGVTVYVENFSISEMEVAVGLLGSVADKGLLGQNFLNHFKMTIDNDKMTLSPKQSS